MELLRHPHGSSPPEAALTNAHGHVPDLHKVFLLPVQALARGKNLKAAKHVSWYDVVVLSGVSHGIEVARAERGETGAWVTRGADVDAQLSALTALEKSKQIDIVEVRVLKVPQIAPFSFWLHSRNNRGDRIIPIISSAPTLSAGAQYTPAKFINAIRDISSQIAENKSAARQGIKLKPQEGRARNKDIG